MQTESIMIKKSIAMDAHQPHGGLLMDSVWPVLIATGSYLVFVTFLGPHVLMANRRPFKLNTLLRVYNLAEVLAAMYLFYLISSITKFKFFDCSALYDLNHESSKQIYAIGNVLLAVRLSEYLDTIFFTLRKKVQQVTFLHVFHHSFVPLYAYWIWTTAPTLFNTFILFINSAIHIVMYSYYFISTFDTQNMSPIMKRLISYKRYMTQAQIVQFVALTLYAMWVSMQPNACNVPPLYIGSNLGLGIGFLTLFCHFYMSTYRRQRVAKSSPVEQKNNSNNSNDSNSRQSNSNSTNSDSSANNTMSVARANLGRKYYNDQNLFQQKFGQNQSQNSGQ